MNRDTHYVYRCFDGGGQPLYVGCSKNVLARWKQHKSQNKHWAQDVSRMKVTVHPNREVALQVEKQEIWLLEPLFNGEVHLMCTEGWPKERYYRFAKAHAESLTSDQISRAHPIGRLDAYYRADFGRSLIQDLGPLMIKRQGRINDLEPVPVMLQIRGEEHRQFEAV